MTTESESSLLQRFTRLGDAEAFAQITQHYAGMVYGTCLRITGNQEAAADAAQDTFFDFLKNARRVTGSLGGWLHQVATRRAIDLVRRDSSRRQREQAYAAQAALETDHWSDVSPLVDEAMNELESPMREVLIGHFLQGQTTVQLAANQGVAQSTISRRIEQALAQLRDKLRRKGVLVAVTALSAWMSQTAQTAPACLLAELGKMAVAGSGTAAGSAATVALSGAKLKAAAAVAALTVGFGGYAIYKHRQPEMSASAPVVPMETAAAPSTTPTGVASVALGFASSDVDSGALRTTAASGVTRAPEAGRSVPPLAGTAMGGMASSAGPAPPSQPMGFGGFGARVSTAPSPSGTPLLALHRFAMELRRGDLSRMERCFVPDSAEYLGFRRLIENPQTDEERRMKQCLESLGQPVEIVETTPRADGLQVRWKATVRRPFSLIEEGRVKHWQEGDRFELEVHLKKVGEDWRIAGF